MTVQWTPLGATISDVTWWNIPDKYNPKREFDRLSKALRYDNSGHVTAEVRMFDPDSGLWTLSAYGWDDTIPDRPAGATVVERRYRLRTRTGVSTFDTPEAALAAGGSYLTEELRCVARDGTSFWLWREPIAVDSV